MAVLKYEKMVSELLSHGFIDDPLGKCRRAEETIKSTSTRSQIHIFTSRSLTWKAYERGDDPKGGYIESRAKTGYLIWLTTSRSSGGDPDHVPFGRVDFDQANPWMVSIRGRQAQD